MAKSKPKIQKRLAKLVLAALLCTGGVQTFFSPSVAEAMSLEKYGTVTKGGETFEITNNNAHGHYGYYLSGDSVVADEKGLSWDTYSKENPVKGYEATLTTSGDPEDAPSFIGGYGEFAATEVSGNKVTVDGEANNWTAVAGGYLTGGYYYAGDVLDTVTVKDNIVTVKSGNVGAVIGGFNAGIDPEDMEYVPGTTTGNQVIINGGQVGSAVGGMAGESMDSLGYISYIGSVPHATVEDNTVTVRDGSIMSVTGGFAQVSGDGDTSVSGNTVTIEGGTVLGAIGGEVYVDLPDKEAELKGTITASDNTVNVKGGTVGTVVGGSSEPYYGSANNNTVNINGGTIAFISEREGISPSLDPLDPDEVPESVTVQSAGIVYGGMSTVEASGNTVNIGKDANVENALIVGGGISPEYSYTYASSALQESGNESISGSAEVMEFLKQAKADNNTVNILGPANVAGLFGGFLFTDTGLGGGKGNTLNVAAKNVSAYTVGGFQNMNFYLPKDIANGDTMLTIKTPGSWSELEKAVGSSEQGGMVVMPVLINKYGAEFVGLMMNSSASGGRIAIDMDKDGNIINPETGEVLVKPRPTDLKGVTFGVAALQGVSLKKGDKVTLIHDDNGLDTDPGEPKTTSSKELGKAEFLQQNSMTTEEKYELSIKKEGTDSIVTYVDDVKEEKKDDPASKDAQKSPLETRIGVMNMINNAGDMLAGQGMSNAAAAAAGKSDGAGFNSFAAVNYGQIRGESGSHVTNKGIGLNLGFARELENKSGKLLFGPVVEYGHGNYDSYQDNGMKADGKASYWGLGFIAKQTNHSGFYYEGSLRVGRTKSDYGSNSIVENSHISYDSSATYWAAHLGAGMLKDIGHNNTLDYYGKYFYSHTGSDSTTIYRDGEDFDRVNFDGVNSNRIRVGARVTHALNERNKIYGGLAYQYEFSGEARATYRQGSAPSPSMKGSSGMIELGWQVKPGEKSPMIIDLGVTGWVGKQRGITANVQANWTF